MAASLQVLRSLALAELLGNHSRRSISNGELHIVSDRLCHKVVRHIAIDLAMTTTANIVHTRCVDSLPRTLCIDTLDTLGYSIGYSDDTWRADHTSCLAGPQVPYRQEALLLADVDHRVYHIVHHLGVGD